MPTLLPLIFPAISAIIAFAFLAVSRYPAVAPAARAATVAFFALALCVLIDGQRERLAAPIVFLVVPLQLCTITALCQATLVRVGQTMPCPLIVPLLAVSVSLHAWLFFLQPDTDARGFFASLVSTVLLATALLRLGATARTPINRAMRAVVGLSAATFALRATLIAGGLLRMSPGSPWAGSTLLLWLSVAHVLTSALWAIGTLLAIGTDLIDLHYQITQVDPLTGLGNRRALDTAIDADITAGPLYGAAMIVDLDHFKKVNDNYGHEMGDFVLQRVAVALAAQFDTSAHVSRIGGEEFAVLIPCARTNFALALAQAARASLSDLSPSVPSAVTASIGLAYRTEGEDMRSLLRRADAALFQAKADGRDVVAVSGT